MKINWKNFACTKGHLHSSNEGIIHNRCEDIIVTRVFYTIWDRWDDGNLTIDCFTDMKANHAKVSY